MAKRLSDKFNDDRSKRRIKKEQTSTPYDLLDMDVNCITCGTRLYVPDALTDKIVAALEKTGTVILICTCGQPQSVHWKQLHKNGQ
jgi:hypothetical protein